MNRSQDGPSCPKSPFTFRNRCESTIRNDRTMVEYLPNAECCLNIHNMNSILKAWTPYWLLFRTSRTPNIRSGIQNIRIGASLQMLSHHFLQANKLCWPKLGSSKSSKFWLGRESTKFFWSFEFFAENDTKQFCQKFGHTQKALCVCDKLIAVTNGH